MESVENIPETWAVVEVMGHSRYAGKISPDTSLGFAMLRVDVPAIDDQAPFSKFIAPASLFAVTPCTEAVAKVAAGQFCSRPLSIVHLPDTTRALPFAESEPDYEDFES